MELMVNFKDQISIRLKKQPDLDAEALSVCPSQTPGLLGERAVKPTRETSEVSEDFGSLLVRQVWPVALEPLRDAFTDNRDAHPIRWLVPACR